MTARPRLARRLLALCAAAGILFPGCSCGARKPPDVDFIKIRHQQEEEADLRSGASRKGPDGKPLPDGKFRGAKLGLEELKELNDAGKKALADANFLEAMAAVKANDYKTAGYKIQLAVGALPGNPYVDRWTKRIEMFRQESIAEAEPAFQAAGKAFVGGDPDVVLAKTANLQTEGNPFMDRKLHYYRYNALEMKGDPGADLEQAGWIESKLRIGEMDAASFCPPVDTTK